MELQLDIDEALIASVKRLTEIDDPQQAILDAVKRYVRLDWAPPECHWRV